MKRKKEFYCLFHLVDGSDIGWRFISRNSFTGRLKILTKSFLRRNYVFDKYIIFKKSVVLITIEEKYIFLT